MSGLECWCPILAKEKRKRKLLGINKRTQGWEKKKGKRGDEKKDDNDHVGRSIVEEASGRGKTAGMKHIHPLRKSRSKREPPQAEGGVKRKKRNVCLYGRSRKRRVLLNQTEPLKERERMDSTYSKKTQREETLQSRKRSKGGKVQ